MILGSCFRAPFFQLIGGSRQAEVGDARAIVLVEKDVLWLEVAVDDAPPREPPPAPGPQPGKRS